MKRRPTQSLQENICQPHINGRTRHRRGLRPISYRSAILANKGLYPWELVRAWGRMAHMTWLETQKNGVGMPVGISDSYWVGLGTKHDICLWTRMPSLPSTACRLMDSAALRKFPGHRCPKPLWNPFHLGFVT